jgi:hypothetical protein
MCVLYSSRPFKGQVGQNTSQHSASATTEVPSIGAIPRAYFCKQWHTERINTHMQKDILWLRTRSVQPRWRSVGFAYHFRLAVLGDLQRHASGTEGLPSIADSLLRGWCRKSNHLGGRAWNRVFLQLHVGRLEPLDFCLLRISPTSTIPGTPRVPG